MLRTPRSKLIFSGTVGPRAKGGWDFGKCCLGFKLPLKLTASILECEHSFFWVLPTISSGYQEGRSTWQENQDSGWRG